MFYLKCAFKLFFVFMVNFKVGSHGTLASHAFVDQYGLVSRRRRSGCSCMAKQVKVFEN
jgi:hypothetical protein